MPDHILIEMMSPGFVLWRCLHDGPLTRESIESFRPGTKMDWDRYRRRNLPLLTALMETYGACGVVALDAGSVVGLIRFYPKEVLTMTGAGEMCMQQFFPAGPQDGFAWSAFPPLENLTDRTLVVHCLGVGKTGGGKDEPYQRKGIGTRMARKLIEWAKQNGWQAIEANANCDLPSLYQFTGSAGKRFWEKLGFRVVATGHGHFPDPNHPFVAQIRKEAVEAGIDPALATVNFTMRLDLA